jgi:hypothetical protein
MEEIILEEWAKILQDWINKLVFKAGTLGSGANRAPQVV